MNRRKFIVSTVGALSAALLVKRGHAQGATSDVAFSIRLGKKSLQIPQTFSGLSYEISHLADPGFFSPGNKQLIQYFSHLGPKGVLRIGGETSDNTLWSPGETTPRESDLSGAAVGSSPKHKDTIITKAAIVNLRGFLDATGWDLIYGLNFGRGSVEQATDEAQYVYQETSGHLLAVQIGNEPDGYSKHGLRPPNWGVKEYLNEWQIWAKAISQHVPKCPLGGPDLAGSKEWFAEFVDRESRQVQMLTSHHYAEGPPTAPSSNIEHLLADNPKIAMKFQGLVAAGAKAHLPYHLTECNSCYRGGKAGVSDAFASALWCADFMMALAQVGVAGVNLHGGGEQPYTPIATYKTDTFSARPLYYGMLLFSEFSGKTMIPVALSKGRSNVTAYAAGGDESSLQVAVINKETSTAVNVGLSFGGRDVRGSQLDLRAPSVDSKDGVTFGGSAVMADGAWNPSQRTEVKTSGGELRVNLPAASATLLKLRIVQ
jgi:hypothetical protein